jgi:hypothetical protein
MKQIDRPDKKWVRQGVYQNSLENFTFRFTRITFYFSPYEVAPYAQGVQKVTFRLSELR